MLFREKMSRFSVPTERGTHVAVFPTDDITVVFDRVDSEGSTTIGKPTTGPEPPEGKRITQYYDIRTEAEVSGKISIRIILERGTTRGKERRLLQWNDGWKDITTHFSPRFSMIVGETDHLSIFGVT
jgi:hypothetical protein